MIRNNLELDQLWTATLWNKLGPCTRLKLWCAADTDVLCSHYIFVSQLGNREGIRKRSRDRPQIQVQLYIQWCKFSIYVWIKKISYGVLKAYLIPWKPTIEPPFCDSFWAQKHIWQNLCLVLKIHSFEPVCACHWQGVNVGRTQFNSNHMFQIVNKKEQFTKAI